MVPTRPEEGQMRRTPSATRVLLMQAAKEAREKNATSCLEDCDDDELLDAYPAAPDWEHANQEIPEIDEDTTDETFITSIKNTSENDLRPPSPFVEDDTIDDSPPLPENYHGEPARKKFWDMFRSQETIVRSRKSRPSSARQSYLSALKNMCLHPEPLGIVRAKGNKSRIDLHSYRIGKQYGKAFAKGFIQIPEIECVNLAANRIDDSTCSEIVARIVEGPNCQSELITLDLSFNKAGLESAKALARVFRSPLSCLITVNLQHNALNSKAIATICEALHENHTVTRLNLSENSFTTPGMVAIGRLLVENKTLEEVYLSWNRIRGLGALRIVEAIGYHNSLRVLDLSWNSLSSCENRSISIAFAESITNNQCLQHLDISNNQLDIEDCKILANALQQNQTIIGLHVVGNQAYVDSKGFLIPDTKKIQVQSQHRFCPIYVYETSEDAFPEHLWNYVDRSCWYCGRWGEFHFTWNPTAVNVKVLDSERVFLHLSIDNWEPDQMQRGNDGTYVLYRVLPPGRTQYFITVSTPDDPQAPTRHFMRKDKKNSRLLRRQGDEAIFGHLNRANYIEMPKNQGRYPNDSAIPRPNGIIIKKHKFELKKSVFAPRAKESHSRSYYNTDSIYLRAFSADWKQCKADRVVKKDDRRRELENVCGQYYRSIVAIYAYYCARSILLKNASTKTMPLEVSSISWAGYIEFLNDYELIDEKSDHCRISDMENVFVAANLEVTAEAKELDNPDRSLTRFEFLECLFRIASNKYYKSECETQAAAMERLIQHILLPKVKVDSDAFREKYLYHEGVCEVLQENAVALSELYEANIGRFCKPGDKKGMSFNELIDILSRFGVFDERFTPRDIKLPFTQSIMLVMDEMTTNTHKKLSFTAFMELLVRISCIKYSPGGPSALFCSCKYNDQQVKTYQGELEEDVAPHLQRLLSEHICQPEALLKTQRGPDKLLTSIANISGGGTRTSEANITNFATLAIDNRRSTASTSIDAFQRGKGAKTKKSMTSKGLLAKVAAKEDVIKPAEGV